VYEREPVRHGELLGQQEPCADARVDRQRDPVPGHEHVCTHTRRHFQLGIGGQHQVCPDAGSEIAARTTQTEAHVVVGRVVAGGLGGRGGGTVLDAFVLSAAVV